MVDSCNELAVCLALRGWGWGHEVGEAGGCGDVRGSQSVEKGGIIADSVAMDPTRVAKERWQLQRKSVIVITVGSEENKSLRRLNTLFWG